MEGGMTGVSKRCMGGKSRAQSGIPLDDRRTVVSAGKGKGR